MQNPCPLAKANAPAAHVTPPCHTQASPGAMNDAEVSKQITQARSLASRASRSTDAPPTTDGAVHQAGG